MKPIASICWVDFHGDLRTAACGEPTTEDFAGTTVFMSSTTCPGCQAEIQRRLSQLAEQESQDRLNGSRNHHGSRMRSQ
jgi:hypothetical protein